MVGLLLNPFMDYLSSFHRPLLNVHMHFISRESETCCGHINYDYKKKNTTKSMLFFLTNEIKRKKSTKTHTMRSKKHRNEILFSKGLVLRTRLRKSYDVN